MTQKTEFEKWWYSEGSQAPTQGLDFEEHCRRMCWNAWKIATNLEREECAKICENEPDVNYFVLQGKVTEDWHSIRIRARSNP